MELALDIIIILLVVIMISYSVILNIKLKNFRNAQNEMATLVGQLNEAISKAQSSVQALKSAATREEARLEALIIKSRKLADELEFITESGTNLADRIERGLIPAESQISEQGNNFNPENTDDEHDSDAEENEMLKALKNVR